MCTIPSWVLQDAVKPHHKHCCHAVKWLAAMLTTLEKWSVLAVYTFVSRHKLQLCIYMAAVWMSRYQQHIMMCRGMNSPGGPQRHSRDSPGYSSGYRASPRPASPPPRRPVSPPPRASLLTAWRPALGNLGSGELQPWLPIFICSQHETFHDLLAK